MTNPAPNSENIPHPMFDMQPLLELLALKLQEGNAYSEYELMSWLQQPEQAIFRADALKHTHTLFQSHFLLMHALYCLQQQWSTDQQALLEISALVIQKKPWPTQNTQQTLDSVDPLAAYYLDLNQLATPEQEIEQLLASFWRNMLQPEFTAHDLSILELTTTANSAEIRQQYRRLAMRHHPDRGGDPLHFQAIQVAYQRLKQGF